MDFETVTLEFPQPEIAHCCLSRPEKRNALNATMITELQQVFEYVQQRARVLLISGQGKAFCAGADLNWMQQSVDFDEAENFDDAWQLATMLKTLYDLPFPTIALANGSCYGGANGLIAACDFAIAHPDSRFCFSEVKLGIIPAVISPYVINSIGHKRARHYFLSAHVFNAQQALEAELVYSLEEDLLTAGMKLANEMLAHQPQALASCKQLLNEFIPVPIEDHTMKATAKMIAEIRTGQEAQQTIKQFLQARK